MSEYAVTIVKESAAIALAITATGALLALLVGLARYIDLRHAMTLSQGAPSLPA